MTPAGARRASRGWRWSLIGVSSPMLSVHGASVPEPCMAIVLQKWAPDSESGVCLRSRVDLGAGQSLTGLVVDLEPLSRVLMSQETKLEVRLLNSSNELVGACRITTEVLGTGVHTLPLVRPGALVELNPVGELSFEISGLQVDTSSEPPWMPADGAGEADESLPTPSGLAIFSDYTTLVYDFLFHRSGGGPRLLPLPGAETLLMVRHGVTLVGSEPTCDPVELLLRNERARKPVPGTLFLTDLRVVFVPRFVAELHTLCETLFGPEASMGTELGEQHLIRNFLTASLANGASSEPLKDARGRRRTATIEVVSEQLAQSFAQFERSELHALFRAADSDGNGLLSLGELVTFLRQRLVDAAVIDGTIQVSVAGIGKIASDASSHKPSHHDSFAVGLSTSVGASIPRFVDKASHTAFCIEVVWPNAQTQTTWQVDRRYSDFVSLQTALSKALASANIPPLPPKAMFRQHTTAFMEERRVSLEAWLQDVIRLPELWHDSNELRTFLDEPEDPHFVSVESVAHNILSSNSPLDESTKLLLGVTAKPDAAAALPRLGPSSPSASRLPAPVCAAQPPSPPPPPAPASETPPASHSTLSEVDRPATEPQEKGKQREVEPTEPPTDGGGMTEWLMARYKETRTSALWANSPAQSAQLLRVSCKDGREYSFELLSEVQSADSTTSPGTPLGGGSGTGLPVAAAFLGTDVAYEAQEAALPAAGESTSHPEKWCSRFVDEVHWLQAEDRFRDRMFEHSMAAGVLSEVPSDLESCSAEVVPHSGEPGEEVGMVDASSILDVRSSEVPDWRDMPTVLASEFQRMKVTNSGKWRVSNVNLGYELASTYPCLLAVPAHATDEELAVVAKQRSKERIPVLTWLHPVHGTPLCRSSQPLAGSAVFQHNTKEDTEYLLKVRQSTESFNPHATLRIIDARPKLNAQANAITGKGFEDVAQSRGKSQIHFMSIENIHVMRASLRAVVEACHQPNDSFGEAISHSRWLFHAKQILRGATFAARCVHSGEPTLVHCSDGWDRTSQLCALAQVLLDPFYRTREGFAKLVEKEWCAFGHMFDKRLGGLSAKANNETSPVFLQWLDAVWQLTHQFPTAFEFTEAFLLLIVDGLFSRWFADFLGDCEHERRTKYRVATRQDRSLWEFVRLRHSRHTLNLHYRPHQEKGFLRPMLTPQAIKLWEGLFLRQNQWTHPSDLERAEVEAWERSLVPPLEAHEPGPGP